MKKITTGTLITGLTIIALTGTVAAYWFSNPKTTEKTTAPAVETAAKVSQAVQPQEPEEDISSAFCTAMADEKSYEDNNLDTYSTLIPGKDGWVFRTNNDFRKDWAADQATISRLLALQSAMRVHNAELVTLMPPVRGMVHAKEMQDADRVKYGMNDTSAWEAYEGFIRDLRQAGVNIVGINRREVNDQFFYKRNHHWSARGAHIAAQKAAQAIKPMSQYAAIPKVTYASQPLPPSEYKSSFAKAFEKICGTQIGTEPAQNYQTAPAGSANSENALFSGDAEPQVILLGTSNSVNDSSEANFDGFLKEFLSTDVLNLSYTGAGIDTSIMAFMNSEHYKNDKPKIVIWEVPGYYDFDEMNETLLSQIIPAAHGDCNTDALASATFKSLPNNGELFAADQDRIDQNNSYLRLAFAQPVKDTFSVKFHYKDGEDGATKLVKFKRSDRYPADGEFYTLFPRMGADAKLSKISIALPKKQPSADVSMQICALPQSGPPPADESM
jgi:alginate biosynthesis protein AlgX